MKSVIGIVNVDFVMNYIHLLLFDDLMKVEFDKVVEY
jgi:hypothetical protein